MLTYWVENKQMEPQQSPYISKEQGKIGSKNKKSKQKKTGIEMLEVMKMLQKNHLDKTSIYCIHGRNTFMIKIFPDISKSMIR